MTKSDYAIEHFDGEDAHGPVTLFISDDGQLAFVCSKDQKTWQLKQHAEAMPGVEQSAAVIDDFEEGKALTRALTLETVKHAFRDPS